MASAFPEVPAQASAGVAARPAPAPVVLLNSSAMGFNPLLGLRSNKTFNPAKSRYKEIRRIGASHGPPYYCIAHGWVSARADIVKSNKMFDILYQRSDEKTRVRSESGPDRQNATHESSRGLEWATKMLTWSCVTFSRPQGTVGKTIASLVVCPDSDIRIASIYRCWRFHVFDEGFLRRP